MSPSAGTAGTAALVALRARAQALHEAWDAVVAPADDDGPAVATATGLRDAAAALGAQLGVLDAVVDPGATAPVREQLDAVAAAAAPVRDVEALGDVIGEALAGVPRALVLGPVADRVRHAVRERRDEAAAGLDAALTGAASPAVLREVDRLVITPPLLERAEGKAGKVLACAAAGADERLAGLRDGASAPGTDPGHDRAVRDAALALAVACTTAADEHGKKARRLGEAAAAVVTAADAAGDADRAGRLLVDLADRAHRRGEPGFTYGRVHALVAARRERAAADLAAALAGTGDDKRRSWLPGR